MPALYAFGRRWQVGTDDFVFPGLLDTTVKSSWLVAAIVAYIFTDGFDAENGNLLRIYMIGMMTTLLIVVVTDVAATWKSMTGHIMDTESRKMVVPLIYLRLFCEAIDIAWNIFGTFWVFGGAFEDIEENHPMTFFFVRRYVICNWASVVVLGLFLAFLFDPLGKHPILTNPDSQNYEDYEKKVSESWEKRFRKYCCFFGLFNRDEEKINGFSEVGRVSAFVLQDTMFVSSDILAGVFAHYKRLKQADKRSRRSYINMNSCIELSVSDGQKSKVVTVPPSLSSSGQILDDLSTEIKTFSNIVFEIDHYFQYVNASSGWRGFLINNKSREGISKLWKSMICCGCLKRSYSSVDVKGDNCCYCNMAVIKETVTDIKSEDLIYASFLNDYYEVPFYIIMDHSTKSYIVAIRGTYSGEDVITDLTAWPVSENFPGIIGECMVHHGMLLSAKKLSNKLKSLGVLEKLRNSHPNYNLVLVGQSLGGGTATILGMMLYPEHPSLKVYVYNPPGGLFSLNAAQWSEKFTTSVVFGTDALARISLPALQKLKKQVIDTIYTCKTPKYKLLLGVFGGLCGYQPTVEFFPEVKSEGQINNAYSTSMSSLSSMDDPEIGKVSTFNLDSTNKTNAIDSPSQPLMYIPGKILHITKNSSLEDLVFKTTLNDPESDELQYGMRWADREEFLEIIVSPRMYADHWHWQILAAFEEYKNLHKVEI